MTTPPPPGWYRDPRPDTHPSAQMWWDGREWTGRTRKKPTWWWADAPVGVQVLIALIAAAAIGMFLWSNFGQGGDDPRECVTVNGQVTDYCR